MSYDTDELMDILTNPRHPRFDHGAHSDTGDRRSGRTRSRRIIGDRRSKSTGSKRFNTSGLFGLGGNGDGYDASSEGGGSVIDPTQKYPFSPKNPPSVDSNVFRFLGGGGDSDDELSGLPPLPDGDAEDNGYLLGANLDPILFYSMLANSENQKKFQNENQDFVQQMVDYVERENNYLTRSRENKMLGTNKIAIKDARKSRVSTSNNKLEGPTQNSVNTQK